MELPFGSTRPPLYNDHSLCKLIWTSSTMPGQLCLIQTHHTWPEPRARAKYFSYLDNIHFIVKSQLNEQRRQHSRSTTQKTGKIFIHFTWPQCQLKYDWLKMFTDI